MDYEDFIQEQLKMLENDFGTEQIKDNVYRLIFRKYIVNIRLEAIIFCCMELYAEIIKRYNEKQLNK